MDATDRVEEFKREPHDDHDGSFKFFRALAPVVWLVGVGVCMVLMLGAVGYLFVPDPECLRSEIDSALQGPPNIAARRPCTSDPSCTPSWPAAWVPHLMFVLA